MSARAIWKGSLKLGTEKVGSESLPVKLYSAVEDRDIHFHLLEKSTLMRVKQRMVHPQTGEELSRDQIKKGFELEPGTFIVLTDDELQSAEPKESRDIKLTRFVPSSQIARQWYDRPYYLGPDAGDSAAYFALAEALDREKRQGVAQWVMRRRNYIGALRAESGYLMLITLRFAEEVYSSEQLPRPVVRPPDSRELKMAEQLVSALEGEFRAEDFHDEYRKSLMIFLKAKAKGEQPRLKIVSRREQPKSIIESLTASIDLAKRRKEKAIA